MMLFFLQVRPNGRCGCYVTPENIEIRDASLLWGKDTVETQDIIRNQLGDKSVQVACIGISGEKLSFISGIVTDGGRVAARSGLGAVMGEQKAKGLCSYVVIKRFR